MKLGRRNYSKEFKLKIIDELKEKRDDRGNASRPKKVWEGATYD